VELSLAQCRRLRELWIEAFPEMSLHLKPREDKQNVGMYIASTITGRVRRNATFCSACNYEFQGLVADAAKIALWLLYTSGFKVLNFIHDEVIVELDEDENLQANCKKIDQLMVAGMEAVMPDVRVGAEGALMRKWYKEAVPIYKKDITGNEEDTELIVWTPAVAAKTQGISEGKEEKFDFDTDMLEEMLGSVSAA